MKLTRDLIIKALQAAVEKLAELGFQGMLRGIVVSEAYLVLNNLMDDTDDVAVHIIPSLKMAADGLLLKAVEAVGNTLGNLYWLNASVEEVMQQMEAFPATTLWQVFGKTASIELYFPEEEYLLALQILLAGDVDEATKKLLERLNVTTRSRCQKILDAHASPEYQQLRGCASRLQRVFPAEGTLIGVFRLDRVHSVIYKGPVAISLTTTELEIMEVVMEGRGSVVTYNALAERLWKVKESDMILTHRLSTYISNIRQKIEVVGDPVYIVTKWGVGVQFFPEGKR